MIPRTLEPEVMDSRQEALDYDSMDHTEVNRIFVDDFLAGLKAAGCSGQVCPVLDVGTGTAQIPIELGRRGGDWSVTAVDLAEHMLALGRQNVAAAGLEDRIRLEHCDAKQLPHADDSFQVVISNSIVHHIPEPEGVLREMLRVLAPGGYLFVRDLHRPVSYAAVDELVATYAGDANAHQQQMLRDSLCAALRLDEVREILQNLGTTGHLAEQTSDRHWTIAGRIEWDIGSSSG